VKILVFKTYTVDCDNKWRSLRCAGHEVVVTEYDDRPHDRQNEFVEYAKYTSPSAIVYIGAVEAHHGKPCLMVDTLRRLKDVAPSVHLCGDAGDEGWWETLELYNKNECFSVQVSMDGSFETPIAKFKNGMILLTPIDVSVFNPRPWGGRIVGGTISGGGSFGRSDTYNRLSQVAGFEWHVTSPAITYEDVGAFMSRCRVIANHSATGNGRHHVKGRVVETGFAGACLLESKNSVTSRWFRPGVEYLEYATPDEAVELLKWTQDCPEVIKQIAENLTAAVNFVHHPKSFWHNVFTKVGLYHGRKGWRE